MKQPNIFLAVDDGIVRRSSQNDLVGTVSDFSLPQSYVNVSLLLKKCKEYPCALATINIPKIYGVNWYWKMIKMRKSSG